MEMFNIDLVAILIFVLPGYYFLWVSGLKPRDGFSLAANSLFSGILITFALNYIYPIDKYTELLSNPLAGAVVLSFWGILFGFAARMVFDPIKRIFS